jgi:hypothetical protein
MRKKGHDRIENRTLMLIEKEMVDTRGVETRGATNDAVHLVPLVKQ